MGAAITTGLCSDFRGDCDDARNSGESWGYVEEMDSLQQWFSVSGEKRINEN